MNFKSYIIDKTGETTVPLDTVPRLDGEIAGLKSTVQSLSAGQTLKGEWNPLTNSPALASTLDQVGDYLVARVRPEDADANGQVYSNALNKAVSNGDTVIKSNTGFVLVAKDKVPGKETVSNTQLTDSVNWKNYPFAPDADAIDKTLALAVRDIKLYNVSVEKRYVLTILNRAGNSNVFIQVFEWAGGVRGPLAFEATFEGVQAKEQTLTLQSGQTKCILTIDFSLIPLSTDINSLTYDQGGISKLTYQQQQDYKDFIDSRVGLITTANSLDDRNILSRSETTVLENTSAKTLTINNASAVAIRFKATAQTFNTFSFPGHNFSHASAVYAFCLVRNTVTGEMEKHFLLFDARTTDYVFLLNKTWSLEGGNVKATFGYCDASQNTFSPDVHLSWASLQVDENLIDNDILFFPGVQAITAGGSYTSGWPSTMYKLTMSSNIVVDPRKSYIQSDVDFVESRIGLLTRANSLDDRNILSRSETTVLENTNTYSVNHTGTSAVAIRFKAAAKTFNTFSFPGQSFSHASAVYAFCVIRNTATGEVEKHFLEFDARTTDYVFLLNRTWSLASGAVRATFGYCDASQQTFNPNLAINWASTVSDNNLVDFSILYLPGQQSILSDGSNTFGWNSTKYKLSLSSNIVVDPRKKYVKSDIDFVDGRVNLIPRGNQLDGLNILSKNEATVLENTKAWGITHDGISAVILQFKAAQKTFNTFSFPGQSFVHPKAVYAFCVVRNAVTGKIEKHFQTFDSRKTDYSFVLNDTWSLESGNIRITLGYCDASQNTFSPGFHIALASLGADPNLLSNDVLYLGGSQPVTSGGEYASGWPSTRYRLSTTTDIVVEPAPISKKQPFSFLIPSKLYMLQTSDYWIYHDNLIGNAFALEKGPYTISYQANRLSDGSFFSTNPFQFTAGRVRLQGNAVNYTMQFHVNDYSVFDKDSKPLRVATKAVQVYSKPKPTGKTINVLTIGDSYHDNLQDSGQWGMLSTINELAQADGNTINWKSAGRKSSYNINTEAVGGWSAADFTSRYVPTSQRANPSSWGGDPNLHSPFMFSTNDTKANSYFSFSEYMSTYASSLGTLDAVVIELGINGDDGTELAKMVTSIRQYSATLPIIVMMVPQVAKAGMNTDVPRGENERTVKNLKYLQLFDGREAEKIYLAPFHLPLHRLYGLVTSNAEQVQYNFNNVPQEKYVSDPHPSKSGGYSLAYLEYQYLLYVTAS